MCGYENELFMERCVCNLRLLRIPLWCTYEQHNWIPMHSRLSSHVVHILHTLHTRIKYYVQIICIYIYICICVCVCILASGCKNQSCSMGWRRKCPIWMKGTMKLYQYVTTFQTCISYHICTNDNHHKQISLWTVCQHISELFRGDPDRSTGSLFGSLVVPGPDRDQPIQLAPIK